MTQFHEAVQAGRMRSFRHRFRHVDILLIDDIHDLSRRERSQEEFFHTFNSLTQAGKQVVLSSDAAPNEIPDLEERLTSRFNCGLVAGIDKPDFETRVEILKAKAALRSATLPDDVASYVAAKVDTNVRELEGTITKMQGLAAVNGAAMDLDLAKLAVGEDGPSSQGHQLTIQDIVDTVTSYYAVRLRARKHTRYSLEEIGGYFGGRDHTTVMHAVSAVNEKRRKIPAVDQDVISVERRLLDIKA
jgi:chromosomal replication initiator protein